MSKPAKTAPIATTAPASTQAPLFAPRALYEQGAERLRQQIFARELQPGSWIDEQRLAQEFGISRTPLREALKVLATEGLVTMKVRRGAYVTEMSRQDVSEVYRLLALLESDAAAELAAHASNEQLAELQQLHTTLEAAQQDRALFFAIRPVTGSRCAAWPVPPGPTAGDRASGGRLHWHRGVAAP